MRVIFEGCPEHGDLRLRVNEAGIDYLVEGLERLREMGPGRELSCSLLDGEGAARFVMVIDDAPET